MSSIDTALSHPAIDSFGEYTGAGVRDQAEIATQTDVLAPPTPLRRSTGLFDLATPFGASRGHLAFLD